MAQTQPRKASGTQPGAQIAAAAVSRLVRLGSEAGRLSLEEVLDVVPAAADDPRIMAGLKAALADHDIDVNSEHASAPSRNGRSPAKAAPDAAETVPVDALGLYLRDAGQTSLLTADDEVRLAKRIERGKEAQSRLAAGLADEADRTALECDAADGRAAMDHLVRANARLVIALAKRFRGQGVPFLDLIQEGNLGLIKAADRFEWRRGNKFSTYATWWVRQSISRALADQGRTIRVPVHMSDRIRRIFRTGQRLEQELGREATAEELGRELDMPTERVEQALRVAQRPLSLELPVGQEDDAELGEFIEDEGSQPEDPAGRRLLRDDLEQVLMSLSHREARVLQLRYGLFDGRAYTLKEVGERFGLTRERIRQIENDALDRLRQPRRSKRLVDYRR